MMPAIGDVVADNHEVSDKLILLVVALVLFHVGAFVSSIMSSSLITPYEAWVLFGLPLGVMKMLS